MNMKQAKNWITRKAIPLDIIRKAKVMAEEENCILVDIADKRDGSLEVEPLFHIRKYLGKDDRYIVYLKFTKERIEKANKETKDWFEGE